MIWMNMNELLVLSDGLWLFAKHKVSDLKVSAVALTVWILRTETPFNLHCFHDNAEENRKKHSAGVRFLVAVESLLTAAPCSDWNLHWETFVKHCKTG
jgi:hypothetical protein